MAFNISDGLKEVKSGSGNHWSATTRQAVVYHAINLQKTADEIVQDVFLGE